MSTHGWAGAGDGPVTVVLHGGGPGCHSAGDFAAVIASRLGRRWLWVDLPGYGDSPEPEPGPVFTSHVRVLVALLDQLGLSEVDIVAQSLGGSVALRLAADRPALVRRIVLIGSQPATFPGTTTDPGLGARARATYYGGDGPRPAKMRTLMAELEWHDPAALTEDAVLARHHASTTPTALRLATHGTPGEPRAVQQHAYPLVDGGPVHQLSAPGTATHPSPEDLGDALGAVEAPTLVIWGRHDPFGGPDYATALTDALPRGDLAVLGATAHHPQAERPDAVAALVDAFLPTERS